MSDEMKYEVHLQNGEVWYCKDLQFVEDLVTDTPKWIDPNSDLVMLGAIEKGKVYCSDVQPAMVYLNMTPVAVKIVNKTIVSEWDSGVAKMARRSAIRNMETQDDD